MRILSISILIILTFALAACGGGEIEIAGPTWEWEAFQDTAGLNDVSVPNPENYTLTLNDDGTASIKADCNQVIWSYELKDSQLTFNTTGPSTLAMCPEGSLDQLFLERLGNTVTYVLQDGKLYLNLFADAGNMVFQSN
jgi:heat shock protein HslJ